MTTRTFKLLAASTALVAAAGSAQAATTTLNAGTQTTPTVFTTANDIFNISGSSIISSTGNPVAIVSSTGTFAFNTSASSIVRSDAVTGTISLAANHGLTGGLAINNSGSIINTNADGAAISLTTVNADSNAISATIVNTGTISGSINFGAAATGNSLTNTGTITGNINGSTGVETITINGGSVTGNVVLGAGNNVLTVSNSSVIGAVTSGAGTDTITLNNATVSGTITDTGTSDDDAIAVSGTTFSTKGAISGYEILNVSATNMYVSNGITGVSTFNIASNSTVNISSSLALAAGSALTNSGTLRIGSGKTVSTATIDSANGIINFVIDNSSTAGKLIVGSDASGMSAARYTLNLNPNSGYIASGTTYTLVDGSATATVGTLATSDTALYRYSLARANSNQDVVLTVGRIATSNAVTTVDGKAIADVLDGLGSNASSTLYTLQSNIGTATTAGTVNTIVESLAPTLQGAGAATVNVAQTTGNQISTRLASLRNPLSGVAAGDATAPGHVWVQGFGSHQSQDSDANAAGYSSNAGGLTLGLDSDAIVDGTNLGVAFSYGQGTVDSDASSNGSTDISTYAATLYGSTQYGNGGFLNSQLNMGVNNYDTVRTVIGAGTAKGSTEGYQAGVKLEAGHDFAFGNLTATPLVGGQYTFLKVDSYTETGAGNASLAVKPEAMNAFDLSTGGELAYAMPLGEGDTLKPALRAKYVYHAGDTSLATTSHFTGGGSNFVTNGVKADKSGIELGAGLTYATLDGVDFSFDYNADIRSNLMGQTGLLKARFAF